MTWLSAAEELDALEGIRRGDADAFRAIADLLQPTLRRLAHLYVDPPERADAIILRTWDTALQGLHMFNWHTPLATWIARLTVAFGRTEDARGHRRPAPLQAAPAPAEEVPGPPDWSDLPWAERWEHAGATLNVALASLPTRHREVVHGRHIERWPPQRVCDVFGLPRATYQQRLTGAHTLLHGSLAQLVGRTGPSPHRTAQIAAITGWLNQRLDTTPERVDLRVLAIYERWAARHDRIWARLIHRLRSSDRHSSELFAAGRDGHPGGLSR